MRISNAKVFLPDGSFAIRDVTFGERIETVEPPSGSAADLDAGGLLLLPGLVDVHTHGALGFDHSDGDAAGLSAMSRWYAQRGVTSLCPTTMTLGEPALTRALHAIRDFTRPQDGARYVGVHLEGPFISRAKCGAQNTDYLHAPDLALLRRLQDAAGGLVRLVTVAPELNGAADFIREASALCTVSIGHTAADHDTARAGFAAGANHATHLFNAMSPLHHRDPGVVGAAFDAGAYAELICDGQHVHPTMVRAAFRLFGEKLVIVSDSLRCAGMPEGEYELGGQGVVMRGGLARLHDGTIAGSTTDLWEEIRNVVSFGLPLADALRAASLSPADSIGCADIGRIAPGCRADLLLADEDLTLRQVFIDGKALS